MRKESKKLEKENSLLDSAFKLFTEKGIKNTSIQEIADNANVGKGTFYLYFKDKYDLQEQLITRKSYNLFHDALDELNKKSINNFYEQIIFIIDYVLNELTNNPESFTKETSEFIIELVECFETKFNEYWPVVEDYLRKKKKYLELSIKAVKKDVENIILKTLENLAQLIHFDQLDGYIATAQEEIKKTGLIVRKD